VADQVEVVMRKVGTCPPVEANSVDNRERANFVGSSMFSSEAWAQIARSLGLSGRELQIVRGTFDDQTELAMAADLHISPSTIHTHVERLHHKLVITDRAQLLLRVTQEFLALAAAPVNGLPPICADRGTPRCPRGH
jgi:DNA-binding NarL/FixJ family response regulator